MNWLLMINIRKPINIIFLNQYNFMAPDARSLPLLDLKEVRIGFLGPLEGSIIVSLGKQMLQGSMLAIEEANKKGGYKGIPFKLMIHNDVGLWGAAANEVVKMDDESVWAWLGSIDDIVSHVAIRATLKLEIPMLIQVILILLLQRQIYHGLSVPFLMTGRQLCDG